MSILGEARRRAAEKNGSGHNAGAGPRPGASRPQFEFIDSCEFLTTDYKQQFLIPHVLVSEQPAVIAGPSKAMKTSIAIDMAVSLAAAAPFLGKFPVPTAVTVAVVSGESGKATLKETALRVIAAKGLDPKAVSGRLQWCFELPLFPDLAQMAAFAERLKALAADVVVIDPVYLCLGGDIDHANLFAMGAAFRVVADVLLKVGVTVVLIHHANRQLKVGEPMELTHLAYSGLEQFGRQFVLMNRRTAYRGDGNHYLWLSAGGSAGHGGLWSVHIEEGTVDERFEGRVWKVEVQTESQAVATQIDRKNAERDEKARKKLMSEETDLLKAIDTAQADGKDCTKTYVTKRYPRLKGAVLADAVGRLLQSGEIEEYPCKASGGQGAKQDSTAYRRGQLRQR
jgi:AAA domain